MTLATATNAIERAQTNVRSTAQCAPIRTPFGPASGVFLQRWHMARRMLDSASSESAPLHYSRIQLSMHSHSNESRTQDAGPTGEPRRRFLARWPSWLMVSGLVAGYGAFAGIIGRFLFPRSESRSWQFVIDVQSVEKGASLTFRSPGGQQVVISRIGESGADDDFIALSSVCPHLGCQVHWEPQNDRFFCPCHNGAFDPQGNPIAGPPKDANQTLPRYRLRIERRNEQDPGLLYIEIETERLVAVNCESSCQGTCRIARGDRLETIRLASLGENQVSGISSRSNLG